MRGGRRSTRTAAWSPAKPPTNITRDERMTRIRTWVARRAMGRLRIDDDIVRHLSTFQRLGETLEIQSPGEMLPIGARTVFRALRTRAAAQIGPDWVWPYWLENQLDPTSTPFVPPRAPPLPPTQAPPLPPQRAPAATGRPSATSRRHGSRSSTRGASSPPGSMGGRSTG